MDEKGLKKDQQLSDEELDQLMSKFDPEAGYRKLTGIIGWIVTIGLLCFSLYQLYTSTIDRFSPQIHRSIHLGFALSLAFLLFPASKKAKMKGRKGRFQITWVDGLLASLSVVVGLYWPLNIDQLVMRVARLELTDLIVGALAIVLVLEATRRVVGLPITIIAAVFLSYAYLGPIMPGFLAHKGIGIDRIIRTMFFTTEGILGTPLKVSSTFIFLFLLFGAFLIKTGVGQYFNDLAVAIAGKRTGGPAKVAIFSSALQGTISGSSVANVVTSGSFTIPMMKRLGYRREFAGAVEAAASTGGQLMPPIMGAAAFLMVEFIGGGITYWEIAKAATIPALLYFTGIWIMTHFQAKKIGLRGLKESEMPNRLEVLKKIYLLAPIFVVVILLMSGMSVTKAALWSIVSAIVVGSINKETRMKPKDYADALINGARTAIGVATATAAAGMIVGVVTITGLGLKMAGGLIALSNDILFLTLLFTMIASLILGMGSPTTANYVITATIAAPALIALDIPVLSAHMFVFYFGIIADITPPVALAAFAASGVSGGEPLRTGVNSAKLAIAAFIIPYIFVYSPELMMIDTTWTEILWIVFTSLTGMIAIGAAMIGYWLRKTHWTERIVALGAGIMLIYPEGSTDFIGLGVFIALFALQYFIKGKETEPQSAGA
ncbi:TRAP transporter permease [Pseudalkalibacillus berkeleyi]|uniref:TRAP transporter permease n=1 Tax=Pseudalkalibacillus berkeleyi TaxID=1069813 RepID=A0ABS9H594_9BACL|nr:TRAP transporter permease [Pseudalkalibacillus berkeleyi]MCF6138980.1 TRAP transporter permease [Pseudalkalibacillus berkeleyi]